MNFQKNRRADWAGKQNLPFSMPAATPYVCATLLLSNEMREVEKKLHPSCRGKDDLQQLAQLLLSSSSPSEKQNKREIEERFLGVNITWKKVKRPDRDSSSIRLYLLSQTHCEVQTDSTKYANFSPSKCCGALFKL